MDRYVLTYPSDDTHPAVTRVTRPAESIDQPVTFDDYRTGAAEDLFDVALYSLDDDNGEARAQSERDLRILIAKGNAWDAIAAVLPGESAQVVDTVARAEWLKLVENAEAS